LQKLKAACNEAIGVLVAATGHTSAIWERLQAAVVVAPSMQDDTAVGQYDISYQLAEIEVSILVNPNVGLANRQVCAVQVSSVQSQYVYHLPEMCILQNLVSKGLAGSAGSFLSSILCCCACFETACW